MHRIKLIKILNIELTFAIKIINDLFKMKLNVKFICIL